jgi:hypothetical protein
VYTFYKSGRVEGVGVRGREEVAVRHARVRARAWGDPRGEPDRGSEVPYDGKEWRSSEGCAPR